MEESSSQIDVVQTPLENMEEFVANTSGTVDCTINAKEKSPVESEYDSAGSYSDEDEGKVIDDGSNSTSHSDDGVTLERQEGDGQESAAQKKVDDDEDKKNPQYIPKKGAFYEHDDRMAEEEEAAQEAEAEKEKDPKKKLWEDKKEKWSHDKFDNSEQAPKSKVELVSIYGYDIRNEDGPPRARRRRRYGRGPNKYTRNWEDEDAYNKQSFVQKPKKKPISQDGGEEFPPLKHSLDQRAKPKRRNEQDEIRPAYNRDSRNSEERITPKQEEPPKAIPQMIADVPDNRHNNQQIAPDNNTGNVNKTVSVSDYNGFTSKGRSYRTQRIGPKVQKKEDNIRSRHFNSKNLNNDQGEVEIGMKKLSIQDSVKGKNSQRQGSVPPRLQSEQKGPKRYSSMRQRSLPEMVNSQIIQQSYYQNEYNQEHQSSNQQVIQNSAVPQIPPNLSLAQQVPVTATPILGAGPQFPPPPFPQAAPPFLPGPVPGPPAFIPQQAPPLLNYVQTPPQFQPPSFQGYQAPAFNAVQSPPTELYQPQGGITYYSTDQQVSQRTVPQKRPKAAIPIVAPPNYESKNKNSVTVDEAQTESLIIENNSGE